MDSVQLTWQKDITTSQTLTGGRLVVDNLVLDGSGLGYTGHESTVTFASDSVSISKPTTVNGKLTATSINIGGGDINASADQINKLASVTSTANELNVLDGVTNITSANINHLTNLSENVQAGLTARYTTTAADAKLDSKKEAQVLLQVH